MNTDLRENLTLLTRSCLMCGTDEQNDDGKQIYHPANVAIPLAACRRCGSTSLFISDSVTVTLRVERHIDWRSRKGRPPRNAPAAD